MFTSFSLQAGCREHRRSFLLTMMLSLTSLTSLKDLAMLSEIRSSSRKRRQRRQRLPPLLLRQRREPLLKTRERTTSLPQEMNYAHLLQILWISRTRLTWHSGLLSALCKSKQRLCRKRIRRLRQKSLRSMLLLKSR